MRNRAFLKKLSVSALSAVTALSLLPALPSYALNLEWQEVDGKKYWYENDVKMGVYGGAGNVWYDGTERGKEIYDPASDAWYWLDAVFDGAKAEGKEVFMPYVYGNEAGMSYSEKRNLAYESNTAEENVNNAKLGFQINQAMQAGTGKWVRYDGEGKMIKGWVTIEGALADIYTDQVGNTYYYDYRTGVMAKGIVEIDGKHFEFDRVTGKLIGETDAPTDEEKYIEESNRNAGKSLEQVYSETIYATPRTEKNDRDRKTEYFYENPDTPDYYTKYKDYTKYDGEWYLTSESDYQLFKYTEDNSTWTSNRQVASKYWNFDEETKDYYLSSESKYTYDQASLKSYNYSHTENFSYDKEGKLTYRSVYDYKYDDKGNRTAMTDEDISYSDGEESYWHKYEYTYTYDDNGNELSETRKQYSKQSKDGEYELSSFVVTESNYDDAGKLLSQISTRKKIKDTDRADYIDSKYEYEYDENGNQKLSRYYYNNQKYVYDEETGEYGYKDELKLSTETHYTYKLFGENWRNVLQEAFSVVDGQVTDTVTYRYVYDYYENGNSKLYEYWYLRNDKLVLSSKSEYEYDKDNSQVKYRYYTTDSNYDNELHQTVYSDIYFSSGRDSVYIDIPDPSYSKGYRHVQQKQIVYFNKDTADNVADEEDIDYTIEYDTNFTWSVGDLGIGDTKERVTKAYNPDGSLYYTETTKYEVKEYKYN